MDIAALSTPFPRQDVHWRVQGKPFNRDGKFSAMALAYIDARDVMDRLDAVCGPENWQSEFSETAKGRVICRLGIKMEEEWVWKADGAGDTDVEGEKGGISDALKRAAVSWGIGRYLYRLDSPWVACEVSEKAGQVYWKRWTEDPWSKVKNAPGEATPQEIATAIMSIAQAPSIDALKPIWSGLFGNARHIAEAPAVIVAKDARKTQLSTKDAA